MNQAGMQYICPRHMQCGRGSRVLKVSDRGWSCHEFEPSTTKEPPCREAMHVKSIELKHPPVGMMWSKTIIGIQNSTLSSLRKLSNLSRGEEVTENQISTLRSRAESRNHMTCVPPIITSKKTIDSSRDRTRNLKVTKRAR
ncbi:hypothetical protein TNCV_330691 [Trichonephila clavipes]|nr:hypothetical protein TNCV_330691 [Trichonephila clavipes]